MCHLNLLFFIITLKGSIPNNYLCSAFSPCLSQQIPHIHLSLILCNLISKVRNTKYSCKYLKYINALIN